MLGGEMKTWEQLSPDEKLRATAKATGSLLEAILEGTFRFNDELNKDDLQARIDGAITEAEKLHTPWFAGEIIMERAGEEIESMAICDAKDALYPEPCELVLEGIAGRGK
jgi:hypothetical protein